MNVLNEVFLQIREANRFASLEPQLRKLAVVLLDNLIEVQLRRRTISKLNFDRTTWYSGVRQYDQKRRFRISRFHDQLLAFAVEQNEISTEERVLLQYGHRVRNAYYHDGGYDELDSEIAILLFYRIIREHFPSWKTGLPFYSLGSGYYDAESKRSITTPGYGPIIFGFEDQLTQKDPFGDEYWEKGIAFLLTYVGSKSLAELMADKIHRMVDKAEHYISTLSVEDGFDWNHVLARHEIITTMFVDNLVKGRKITDLNAVLNIYSVIVRSEEELLDIEDRNIRETRFIELLNAHKFTTKIPSDNEFVKNRTRAESLAGESEATAVKAYLEIEESLQDIIDAAEYCLLDLEAYSDRD